MEERNWRSARCSKRPIWARISRPNSGSRSGASARRSRRKKQGNEIVPNFSGRRLPRLLGIVHQGGHDGVDRGENFRSGKIVVVAEDGESETAAVESLA